MHFFTKVLQATIASVIFLTGTSFGQWTSSSSSAYLTDTTKNVSIGRKIFKNKLDVNGAMAIGTGYAGVTAAPANGLMVSGSTGIGTTTIGSKLQINGNAAIGYSTSTVAPTNGLAVSGNTGIGTTSIGSKLQINGNAAIGYSASQAAPANGLLVSGPVGIGTTTTGTCKLAVAGKIAAREVIVTQATSWPDFVFQKGFNLKSLDEVEKNYTENKHLENIPTAAEVKANGIPVGEMQVKLLQKMEEMTMYMVALNKENKELKKQMAELYNEIGK